jgi:hypothetical protein
MSLFHRKQSWVTGLNSQSEFAFRLFMDPDTNPQSEFSFILFAP